MTKIVYNTCYGGFGLSKKAEELYATLCLGKEHPALHDIPRHDPLLVEVVETLGDEASGNYACLDIAEIEGNRYFIDEYDGNESVETPNNQRWTFIDTPELREEFPEDYL